MFLWATREQEKFPITYCQMGQGFFQTGSEGKFARDTNFCAAVAIPLYANS